VSRRHADEAELLAQGRLSADPTVDTVVVNPGFWRIGLIVTDKGPKRCIANVMHVLSMHPDWSGVLAWDAFGQAVVTRSRPPMRAQDAPANYAVGDWADEDSVRTAAWFIVEVGFEPGTKMVDEAVAAAARRHVVHPIRDWLSSLTWDGVTRLSAFASSYLGAPETKYAAAVGRRWMIAAVARVYEPGCKVDSLLGLEGAQGIGKSSALRLLAGAEWFADTGISIGDKDSYQSLRRKWIYEFAELASIRGREIERVKNFLSSQVDTYRASYGRRTQDHPRQVIFAGSTNEQQYLADPTGSRRFWPLRCGTINLRALARDRDQLWAEARAAYEAGEPWHLDTTELRALAAAEAEERAEHDDWEDIVGRWLARPSRDLAPGVTTGDVLIAALNVSPDRITPAATQRIGRVMSRLGLHRRQVRLDGARREWRYFLTGDAAGDDASAENGSCHHVTSVTDDPTYTRSGEQADINTHQAKPAVTTVTGDIRRRGHT